MMLPTHALSGMALALPLLFVVPEFAPLALIAGLLGGIFPDFDMYVNHRKTLHFPVYYSVFALIASGIALLIPIRGTVAIAIFLLGAALHCLTDILGSGLELRPWEGTSDRAVYDHYRGMWIPPWHLIRYDGAPADLLLTISLSLPLIYTLEGGFQWLVLGLVVVAAVYTALRRRLADLAATIVRRLPTDVRPYVPKRYLEGIGSEASVTGR